ncbi:MAG: (S)-ureidoglycine aminohydrolase [Planctomycetota bacterium]
MRPIESLVYARTRVGRRYALMPLEGFPPSRLPGFPEAVVRVLASPALGAEFVQYLIDMPAGTSGRFADEPGIETFYYAMAGSGDLRPGSFGLIGPDTPVEFEAEIDTQLLVLRKRYEPAPNIEPFAALAGHVDDVEKTVWEGNPDALLQELIPPDFAFDMAMNIFTFSPGHGLPIVETHVMEHGLYLLDGKGMYYLDGDWMEVEQHDYIYMAPFCPQSYYATGPTPTRYLYYKNVNREVRLLYR